MNQRILKMGVLMTALVAFSGTSGYWFAMHSNTAITSSSAIASGGSRASMEAGQKVLYWYDPMVPNQHFDKPGKSPFMDMQLVAKYADEGGEQTSVKIDPGVMQNLGIRLVKVARGMFDEPINAVANVLYNDRDVAVIQARTTGFVERVYARAPGDVIAKGAPLVDVLVPEWGGAQTEFLAMLKTGDRDLAAAARQRLRLLGMSEDLIASIERTGQPRAVVTISTPIAGEIQTLEIRAGMTVEAGMTMAKINGIETVWLEAAIPEAQGSLVQVNKMVEVGFAAYPGETFTGKVIAVLPELNSDSRTLRIRVELPNSNARFKPGMFAQIRFDAGMDKPVLYIPSEAIIRTGLRNLVIVATDIDHFQPVEIQIGHEANGKTSIVDGLTEGQQIVTSGQFLIDSEASLSGVMARMNQSNLSVKSPPAIKSENAVLHEGKGKIDDLSEQEITLSHGPIPSIGWGAMTMSFKLEKRELARSLKTGDIVDFAFKETNDGYVIEKLTKAGVKND